MKKTWFILAFALAFAATNAPAQGIEFFHGTWAEALEKAKTEQRLIFVDAFASWCGPCKRMASQTFPDPSVGEFFNANFVCQKIDMEKPENEEFAKKFPVGSYPTLMFINAEGKLVAKDIGAKSVEELLDLGKRALGFTDKSPEMGEKYAAGERDPKFVFEYVKTLNQFGKPSLKIVNEYLKTQTDLTSEFNLRFILEGAVECDSRVFDLLLKNRSQITALTSEPTVKNKIRSACQNTARKAIEFNSPDLLNEANKKFAANFSGDEADEFEFKSSSAFYSQTKDAKGYLKTIQGYQKRVVKNNAAKLSDLVTDLFRNFPNDPDVLAQAEKWAKIAAENGGLPEYQIQVAEIQRRRGDKAAARASAEKAKKMANDKQPSLVPKIDYFIQSLDEG